MEKNYKLLSVVIPAFKQEKTIKRDILTVENALKTLLLNYEILIVVDGMLDRTYKEAKKLKSKNIKVLSYKENLGKGYAVKYGMLRAKGDVIGFIDAGMDIDPQGFSMLLNHMDWYKADIIVGSKMHPVSKVDYPLYRRILSWGYRFLTRILFGFKVRDTQVGLKFFKRRVVKEVMPRLVVKKFAFDIEILAVSYARGFKRIYEAPVEINFRENSIVSGELWRVILSMLWDTLAVFYRLKILRFYDRKLPDIRRKK